MQGVSPVNLGQLSQVKEKEEVTTDSELVKEDDSSPDENRVTHHVNGAILDDSKTTNLYPESEIIQNGVVVEIVEGHDTEVTESEDGALKVGDDEQEEELEDMKRKRWSFPPILDDFDLMTTEKDPAELEDIFADQR